MDTKSPEDQKAIRLLDGLLGFPQSLTYMLSHVDGTPYIWLKSAEEDDVAFLAVSPFPFFPDYDFEISEEQERSLGLEDVSQVQILTLVTVHRDAAGAISSVTANLLGPIVINTESGSAQQIVLDDTDYSTQVPLAV